MKNKKHINYFILDHLWVIILFLIAPIGFFFLYAVLWNFALEDFSYYFFLASFILICALGWRLYVTWDIYEQFLNDSKGIEDYIIAEAKCNQAVQYRKLLKRIQVINKTESNALLSERKNQKLMMYQWIHQMKTPLSVMKLLAENHKDEGDFRKIALSVQQLQYNLDQILNIYQLDAIENEFSVQKIELHEICKKTINDLKDYFISNQVYPKLEIPKGLYIYSDPRWLQLVIYQLLTNAIKYSPENAKISLQTEVAEGKVILRIVDEGCGIPRSDYDRIFEMFFVGENGRARGESSGIGLYMVKKIITYLGHHIEVDSKEGVGSVFKIIFN